ncbi:MAG TPA: (2Fe-2S) ferredoxin domain-containing protein, partial [Candidatus Methylomirabilis sp.]
MVNITVGMATCGVSAGAAKVFEVFRALVESNAGKAKLGATGCLGMCYREPLVEIDDGSAKYIYGEVDGKKAKQIFQGHVLGGEPVEQYLVLRNFTEGREYGYLARQVKIVLRNCGYL